MAADEGELLADCSLEVAGKDIDGLEHAQAVLPPGTRFHVAFVDSEDLLARMRTTRAIQQAGFVPVPVISARRLVSAEMLWQYLAELRAVGASERVAVVGGDPPQPRGPYPDAASVIASGALEQHGVREVSVTGHPGGHPAVPGAVLWEAIAAKTAALARRGLRAGVITQFGFDATQVLAWLAELRARGLTVPLRVGVPGPASVRTVLAAAAKCDVSVSAPVAREYGFSLADRTGTATPDRFIHALAAGYDRQRHGAVKLHFSTFSGVAATAGWIGQFRSGRFQATGLSGRQQL
jgi:methylenetetrahydrofolate reductase (NADPH)